LTHAQLAKLIDDIAAEARKPVTVTAAAQRLGILARPPLLKLRNFAVSSVVASCRGRIARSCTAIDIGATSSSRRWRAGSAPGD